jgi:hypothetical protein
MILRHLKGLVHSGEYDRGRCGYVPCCPGIKSLLPKKATQVICDLQHFCASYHWYLQM